MIEMALLRALEAAGLSGLRPSWALAAVSAAGASGAVELPQPFHMLGHWPVFGVLLVVAALEHMGERDVEMSRLLTGIRYGLTACSAWASSATMAVTDGEAPQWVNQSIGIVLGLGIAVLRTQVRRRALDAAEDVGNPAKWIARAEESALVLGAVLLVFAPLILLGVLVLMVLGGLALLVMARIIDRKFRRPCPSCGHQARREARLCAGCGSDLEPQQWLRHTPRLVERMRRLQASSESGYASGDQPQGG